MNDRYLYRLYRAKRCDTGEWVEGYYFKKKIFKDSPAAEHFIMTSKEPKRGRICKVIFYCIDPSTICRCTGKTDIERNLIFEHDAVSFLDATSTEYGYSEHWQVGEVLWDDETASFQVTERLSAESYEVLDDCKVLGNTIDNPELLEVGE